MAITDLTDTTWEFNAVIDVNSLPDSLIAIGFESNNTTYYNIINNNIRMRLEYSGSGTTSSVYWYDASGLWADQSYRTVHFTGDGDVTNSAFISWLETNAIQIIVTSPVEISYNNTTVASLSIPGSYAYFGTCGDWIQHDIIIKCDPISPNQVIVSTYNFDDEEIDTVYTATSEGTLTLDTEEAWTPYNIKVLYGEPPAPPSFTIDGVTYEFEEDMDWVDWCESTYNTDGFSIDTDYPHGISYIYKSSYAGNVGVLYNSTVVSPGDTIVADTAYTSGAMWTAHNLINTTWQLNYPDFDWDNQGIYQGSFTVNFTCNNVNYTSISYSAPELYYNNTEVYGFEGDTPDWHNSAYQIITITGGTDATNAKDYLYMFLTSSGTQVQSLAGTTWLFPNSYNDMSMPWNNNTWNINFTSNNTNYTSINPNSWTLIYGSTTVFAPQGGPPGWYNQNYRTIAITGGSDVYSSSLRSWLTANATQQ